MKVPYRIRRRHIREAVEHHLDQLFGVQDEDGKFYQSFLDAVRDEMRNGYSFRGALEKVLNAPETSEYVDGPGTLPLDEGTDC